MKSFPKTPLIKVTTMINKSIPSAIMLVKRHQAVSYKILLDKNLNPAATFENISGQSDGFFGLSFISTVPLLFGTIETAELILWAVPTPS